MIKAVLLDIDDTLLDFARCAERSMAAGFQDFGLSYDPAMFAVFQRINNGLWAQIETGDITREELFAVRWNRIFEVLGIRSDGPAFEKRFLHHLEESAVPVDGAGKLVAYLAPRYMLCAASNGPHLQQVRRLEKAGMTPGITHVFTSQLLEAEKPSPAFFQRCFERLSGIAPEETMMIGDSLTADMAGAKAYGMQTCWYAPHAPKEMPVPRPDHIVTSLAEITAIL